MIDSLTKHTIAIGWNGLRLQSPQNWEVIVSEPEHLVFEEDFEPVLQIRWKTIGPLTDKNWSKKSAEWWNNLGLTSKETALPAEMLPLNDTYTHVRYFRGKGPMESGGVCYCSQCNTVVIFQLLSTTTTALTKISQTLSSICCHGFKQTLWQIQDFSIQTPLEVQLTDYTFKAGLSRLSFKANNYTLQICRLGQAATRLAEESLQSTLLTLAGTRELQTELSSDNISCHASRCPSLGKQILLRMRKEKPFIEARIWQVVKHDRLLACLISSTRPISEDDVNYCYETFKIV
ncbi:hypothetical protein [Desulforhopalus sp. 52FAK]